MQKPNLDSVKKHFENDGWNVRLEYSSDYVKLYANKTITTGPASTFNTNEFLEAYFAYRAEDMDLREKHENKAADKRNLEDLKKYQEVWGEKVIYLGSPKAVAFYEKEFGVSSAASGQVFPSTKLVSAVEAAFKKAGYSVDLSGTNIYDVGTDIEIWPMACMTVSPMNTLSAVYGYSEDYAKQLAEATIPAATAANLELKRDGSWYYYGTPDAIKLFESLGTQSPVVLYAPVKVEVTGDVAKLEAAFKAAGYNVTITPMGGSTMVNFSLASPFNMLIGILCASAEEAKTTGQMYGASAAAMKMEVKYKGKWFYYGNPDAMKLFEDTI